MSLPDVLGTVGSTLVEHRDVLTFVGLGVVVIALILTIRRAVKGGRPDRWIDAVAFLGALAFSAEGMWEFATEKIGLLPGFAALVFFLFEAQMVAAMYRANRHYKMWGHPGKHGRAVWVIAGIAGVIVASGSDSLVVAPLRLAIPLLAAYQWWLGLTADGLTEDKGAVSWRWTPRRLLLALGAIEPGERDVQSVDRERRVAQMTRLEYRRRHGWPFLADVRGARLARLSLTADDDMIAAVRQRVDRASWFQVTQPEAVGLPADERESLDESDADEDPADPWDYAVPIGPEPVPQQVSTPALSDNVSDKKTPTRKPPPSSRDRVIAAHNRTPDATDAALAARLGLSVKTIERHRPAKVSDNLSDSETSESSINGHVPELEVAR